MAPSAFPAAKTAPEAGMRERSHRPHPAVARIVVSEEGAIAYGSGTLIDVRENFGMVITNWHVVRDATDTIEVIFPDGFTSKARAIKVDADWDLAALVIWRPTIEPVSIATQAPQPGDRLTICGYGQGTYRTVTGRCTQYYAPRIDFPRHMVELDVEARQGDSGGPIFNTQGELAGVLFGAGQGTTLGSFGGRVEAFLATLAPDIGRAAAALAASDQEEFEMLGTRQAESHRGKAGLNDYALNDYALNDCAIASSLQAAALQGTPYQATSRQAVDSAVEDSSESWPEETEAKSIATTVTAQQTSQTPAASTLPSNAPTGKQERQDTAAWQPVAEQKNTFEQIKTILAAIGLLAIVIQMLRVAR